MIALLATLSLAHAETVAYASLSGGLGFLRENMGDFAVGAEHRLGEHHGLLLEGTLIHVHGNPTHATTRGVQAGYRYHIGHAFVGVVGGYELGHAKYFTAEHGGPYYHYGLKHKSLIPHIGYRWGLGERGALSSRVGAGYGAWEVRADEQGAEVEAAQQRVEDRIQTGPVKLDLELSIGLRF